MWLSLILALLSYFLTSRATNGDKTKSALAALAVGAGSYYAVSNTEWGANAAESFNGAIGVTNDPALQGKVTTAVNAGTATTANPPAGTSAWDVLKSWGATGTAMVAGTVAVGSSSNLQKYLPWAIAGLGVFFLLK